MSERGEQERRELVERFGGRLRYLSGEYVRRGLLTAGDAGHLDWECGALHWIIDAATSLEALAHRL
jgi:hypothetical protein